MGRDDDEIYQTYKRDWRKPKNVQRQTVQKCGVSACACERTTFSDYCWNHYQDYTDVQFCKTNDFKIPERINRQLIIDYERNCVKSDKDLY